MISLNNPETVLSIIRQHNVVVQWSALLRQAIIGDGPTALRDVRGDGVPLLIKHGVLQPDTSAKALEKSYVAFRFVPNFEEAADKMRSSYLDTLLPLQDFLAGQQLSLEMLQQAILDGDVHVLANLLAVSHDQTSEYDVYLARNGFTVMVFRNQDFARVAQEAVDLHNSGGVQDVVPVDDDDDDLDSSDFDDLQQDDGFDEDDYE